tara:strand:- start:1662 stop:1793 length:132 start_codon:yes stop_codon:yes gene_type:complete
MSDLEFVFALSIYILIVPYVIDPPTPYEKMKEIILRRIQPADI